jgi:hypothetical protein
MPAAPNPTAGAPTQETTTGAAADLVPVLRAVSTDSEGDPPLERLYLRLSTIRI